MLEWVALKMGELALRLKASLVTLRGIRDFIDDYPIDEILLKPPQGRGGCFPPSVN
jgi:glutamate synthase (NADPH) GltB2 subunit (EC 1.4.1.13)